MSASGRLRSSSFPSRRLPGGFHAGLTPKRRGNGENGGEKGLSLLPIKVRSARRSGMLAFELIMSLGGIQARQWSTDTLSRCHPKWWVALNRTISCRCRVPFIILYLQLVKIVLHWWNRTIFHSIQEGGRRQVVMNRNIVEQHGRRCKNITFCGEYPDLRTAQKQCLVRKLISYRYL